MQIWNKITVISLLIAVIPLCGVSQNPASDKGHILRIKIENYPDSSIYWASIYGDEINITDTITERRNDVFLYEIPLGTQPGVYRLMLNDGKRSLDVVYTENDISLHTDFNNLLKELEVKSSLETQLFHRHKQAEGYIRYKQKLINRMLEQYPKDDPFYDELENKNLRLQQEIADTSAAIVDAYPDSFVAKLVAFQSVPSDTTIQSFAAWQHYQKAHYFDNADFSDNALLRSNAIPDKLLGFMSLYRNPSYPKARQEEQFRIAVDTIMKYTRTNAEVFDFTINFLIDGFKRFGFNDLVNHIAGETEAALSCINRERRDALKARLNRIQATSPGQKAPEVKLPDLKGDSLSLYSVKKPYTLVVFWASWCPHCKEMMPDLQQFYENHNDSLEIFAISIDSEREKWTSVAKTYPWMHVSELKGWDSGAVEDYYVYGTPSFFLLGEQKKILKKGATLRDIENYYKQITTGR